MDEKMPTHEIMAWLNDVERDRFVKLQELFETPGWLLFVEQAQAQATYNLIRGANGKTWEETVLARGMRSVWESVAKSADDVMKAFEQAAMAAKEAAAEATSTDDPDL